MADSRFGFERKASEIRSILEGFKAKYRDNGVDFPENPTGIEKIIADHLDTLKSRCDSFATAQNKEAVDETYSNNLIGLEALVKEINPKAIEAIINRLVREKAAREAYTLGIYTHDVNIRKAQIDAVVANTAPAIIANSAVSKILNDLRNNISIAEGQLRSPLTQDAKESIGELVSTCDDLLKDLNKAITDEPARIEITRLRKILEDLAKKSLKRHEDLLRFFVGHEEFTRKHDTSARFLRYANDVENDAKGRDTNLQGLIRELNEKITSQQAALDSTEVEFAEYRKQHVKITKRADDLTKKLLASKATYDKLKAFDKKETDEGNPRDPQTEAQLKRFEEASQAIADFKRKIISPTLDDLENEASVIERHIDFHDAQAKVIAKETYQSVPLPSQYRKAVDYLLTLSYFFLGSQANQAKHLATLKNHQTQIEDSLKKELAKTIDNKLNNQYDQNSRKINAQKIEELQKALEADRHYKLAKQNILSLQNMPVHTPSYFNRGQGTQKFYNNIDEARATYNRDYFKLTPVAGAAVNPPPVAPNPKLSLISPKTINAKPGSREAMLPEIKMPDVGAPRISDTQVRIIESKHQKQLFVIEQTQDDKKFVSECIFKDPAAFLAGTPDKEIIQKNWFGRDTKIPGKKDMIFARNFVENHNFRNVKYPNAKLQVKGLNTVPKHLQEAILLYILHKGYALDDRVKDTIKNLGIDQSKLDLVQKHFGTEFSMAWNNKSTVDTLFAELKPKGLVTPKLTQPLDRKHN